MTTRTMTRESKNREGFWASRNDYHDLPEVAEGSPWHGQREFLTALATLEKTATGMAYRGWSTCRLCEKHNGNVTFFHDGWEWPQGYAHYISVHNVRPSLAFQEFVLRRRLG